MEEEKKLIQLGAVEEDLNNKINDYVKLIGKSKIGFIKDLILKELEGKVLTKEFIIPENPFYFNMNELLTKGTAVATTKKPSTDFNKYYTVKKIANNLDSYNAEFKSYCYNKNPVLHRGIFIYYRFSQEAKPVPLVLDYNSEEEVIDISLIKLNDLNLLIESEEDVATIETIISDVKENVENYISVADGVGTFNIIFMASISEVIEDFSGRKKIELLSKFNVDDFKEDLSLLEEVPLGAVKTSEDIFKMAIEDKKEFIELRKMVKDTIEAINNYQYRDKTWEELKEEDKEAINK